MVLECTARRCLIEYPDHCLSLLRQHEFPGSGGIHFLKA